MYARKNDKAGCFGAFLSLQAENAVPVKPYGGAQQDTARNEIKPGPQKFKSDSKFTKRSGSKRVRVRFEKVRVRSKKLGSGLVRLKFDFAKKHEKTL